MPVDITTLNAKFGIPGAVEAASGRGGLTVVRVTAAEAAGEMYLHGGHVTAWQPVGMEEVLWLSGSSFWQDGKPIRGGVPICFPWFGRRADDASLPQHGFVRLREWELESVQKSGGGVEVVMALRSDDSTMKLWPHRFELRHRVTIGRELRMSLEVTNADSAAFNIEEAQHTYFSVGDVRRAAVKGLDGVKYVDKADGMKEKLRQGDITFSGETDGPYFDTTASIVLEDPIKGRRITVEKGNSRSTVVWNPWDKNARAMPDFGDDEWPWMLCIETCNVGPNAVSVGPGETHTMQSHITCVPR